MKISLFTLILFAMSLSTVTAQQTRTLTQQRNTFTNPVGLFNPVMNGFSHVGHVPANADLYFIAGQWASNTEGKLVSTDFAEQVRQTLRNLKTALAAVGLNTQNVVKQTVYIADYTPEKKRILIEVAANEWDATVFPVGAIIPLPMLATAPGCLIEIEAVASR